MFKYQDDWTLNWWNGSPRNTSLEKMLFDLQQRLDKQYHACSAGRRKRRALSSTAEGSRHLTVVLCRAQDPRCKLYHSSS